MFLFRCQNIKKSGRESCIFKKIGYIVYATAKKNMQPNKIKVQKTYRFEYSILGGKDTKEKSRKKIKKLCHKHLQK
jgi:hypothetical protein